MSNSRVGEYAPPKASRGIYRTNDALTKGGHWYESDRLQFTVISTN